MGLFSLGLTGWLKFYWIIPSLVYFIKLYLLSITYSKQTIIIIIIIIFLIFFLNLFWLS